MNGDVKPCPDCDGTFVAYLSRRRCEPCAATRAAALRRSRGSQLPPLAPDHPLTVRIEGRITTLSAATHLAVACLRTGRTAEALEVLERAL